MQLGCNFAVASLGLEHARQRDELAGYSRISKRKTPVELQAGRAQQVAHGARRASLFADHPAQIIRGQP